MRTGIFFTSSLCPEPNASAWPPEIAAGARLATLWRRLRGHSASGINRNRCPVNPKSAYLHPRQRSSASGQPSGLSRPAAPTPEHIAKDRRESSCMVVLVARPIPTTRVVGVGIGCRKPRVHGRVCPLPLNEISPQHDRQRILAASEMEYDRHWPTGELAHWECWGRRYVGIKQFALSIKPCPSGR